MTLFKRTFIVIFLVSILGFGLPVTGKELPLPKQIDALMKAEYPADKPGAAVIVRQDGKTLFRSAYGSANLELGLPLQPDMVFRLGSVTKQFTGVAILMLEEAGKLKVDDSIAKYLPDFPTKGKTITIEHLLTHTSGIKSYTDMIEWLPLWRKDMKVDELIALFKDLPLEFDPGTQWSYSNSGYILLGAIIEKTSGMTYADFIEQKIFKPLGMKNSCYGDTEKIIPRRVSGYEPTQNGYINAPYLSMTQPYAAGSLLANVDDMALWHESLLAGKLIKPENLKRAHSSYLLADGTSTAYGYGWMMSEFKGHPAVEHGGGINGFSTYVISLPKDRVYVALLQNSIGEKNPEPLAYKIATLVAGISLQNPQAVSVSEEALQGLCGVYQHALGDERVVTYKEGYLYSQRGGGTVYQLIPVSAQEFYVGDSLTRLRFIKGADGMEVWAVPRTGMISKGKKIEKALTSARIEIKLDVKILERYIGVYELVPGFEMSITLENGALMTQATGQDKVAIYAESEFRFFLKVVDAQLEFKLGADGRAESMTLFQGGQAVPAKRIR